MAPKKSLLKKMKANPRNDWSISDIERLCKAVGVRIRSPSGGSHYTVSSPLLDGILTVPAKRPIKPVYIRSLVGLCEAHLREKEREEHK